MTSSFETTQRFGHIRVVETEDEIFVQFYKRLQSSALTAYEARSLAKMLNAAARRVEGRQKAELKDSEAFVTSDSNDGGLLGGVYHYDPATRIFSPMHPAGGNQS